MSDLIAKNMSPKSREWDFVKSSLMPSANRSAWALPNVYQHRIWNFGKTILWPLGSATALRFRIMKIYLAFIVLKTEGYQLWRWILRIISSDISTGRASRCSIQRWKRNQQLWFLTNHIQGVNEAARREQVGIYLKDAKRERIDFWEEHFYQSQNEEQ